MNTFQPQVEQLESRVTPTTASMVGGILVVYGTDGADDILVTKNTNGSYSVSGVSGTFGGVSQVRVYGQAGDDRIEVAENITISTYLYGWAGDDTLVGGSGHDFLYGNDGDDTLMGRGGNDYMNGWSGNDTFVGGVGFDTAVDFSGEHQSHDGVERFIYY